MNSVDLSDRFRVFADALEALGRAEGEIVDTSLHPDALAADGPLAADVTVAFSLPGVSDAPEGVDVAVRDVRRADDGSIAVTCRADLDFGVGATGSGEADASGDGTAADATGDGTAADAGADGPSVDGEMDESDAVAGGDGTGADDSEGTGEAVSATSGDDGPGEREDPPGDDGRPAYRDPERLRAVYDEHDTFAAMTEALGVDVTPQTVRRYMVEFGIHEPRTRASDRLAQAGSEQSEAAGGTEAATDGPAETDGRDDSETDERDDSETGERDDAGTDSRDDAETDERPRIEPDDAAAPGSSEGDGVESPAPETDAGATTAAGTPETDGTEPGGADPHEANGGGTTAEAGGAGAADDRRPDASDSPPADAVDRVLTEELDLPERVTLVELTRAVKTSRTLHEVAGQLDVDRDRAREALTALDLLPLVTGRLADADRPVTDDEVEARIRGALEGTAPGATS